jgi:hypothetical protein
MAKRGPLSAAHKAAISAGLKRYHAGRGSSSGGSSGGGGRRSAASTPKTKTASVAPPKVSKASGKSGSSKPPAIEKINKPQRPVIQNISTGKPISREEAARIMFGSAGAAKKLAAGKKARRRR